METRSWIAHPGSYPPYLFPPKPKLGLEKWKIYGKIDIRQIDIKANWVV
jgi:hypothetical protein